MPSGSENSSEKGSDEGAEAKKQAHFHEGVEDNENKPNPTRTQASVGHGFEIQGSQANFDGGTANTSSLSGSVALPMSWYKLNYSAGSLKILRGLTGTALPNRCLAIMGSSGAGKTTFLNAVCDRLADGGKMHISGRRQLGDAEFERHYRKALGFVTQDDVVSSLATPYDSLWFSVRTRRGTSRADTEERVQETLKILSLVHCKDTKVGVPGLEAGLSGGERKRCNIGIELICDPKVLLLDEPTSGLDSVTSAKVVHLLRALSRMGRTVIYTIHQPTAEVLSYFDDLMLMTQGRTAYHGTMDDSIAYFDSIGFVCPDKYTPTDYYMVLLQDYVTSKVLIKRWRKFIKNGPRTAHTTCVRMAPSKSESYAAAFLDKYIVQFGSSPFVQLYELVKRTSIEISRDFLYIFSYASSALFFSCVVGLIFLHVRMNIGGMTDRQGFLFMHVMQRAMGPAFIMVSAFYNIRAVYTREQNAGAYSPGMFYLGRDIAELPILIVSCIVEVIIIYFMVGLHADPGAFFYYFGVMAVLSLISKAFGFAISTTFPSLVVASAITPLIMMPLSLAGGLFASTNRLRPYWYWIEKPSFMRQAYILVMRNEFKYIDRVYCNNYKNGDQYCINQYHTGNDVLVQLGFNSDPQSTTPYMWLSLAVLYVVFVMVSLYSLTRVAHEKG